MIESETKRSANDSSGSLCGDRDCCEPLLLSRLFSVLVFPIQLERLRGSPGASSSSSPSSPSASSSSSTAFKMKMLQSIFSRLRSFRSCLEGRSPLSVRIFLPLLLFPSFPSWLPSILLFLRGAFAVLLLSFPLPGLLFLHYSFALQDTLSFLSAFVLSGGVSKAMSPSHFFSSLPASLQCSLSLSACLFSLDDVWKGQYVCLWLSLLFSLTLSASSRFHSSSPPLPFAAVGDEASAVLYFLLFFVC